MVRTVWLTSQEKKDQVKLLVPADQVSVGKSEPSLLTLSTNSLLGSLPE
jgi:hypothetical protein